MICYYYYLKKISRELIPPYYPTILQYYYKFLPTSVECTFLLKKVWWAEDIFDLLKYVLKNKRKQNQMTNCYYNPILAIIILILFEYEFFGFFALFLEILKTETSNHNNNNQNFCTQFFSTNWHILWIYWWRNKETNF